MNKELEQAAYTKEQILDLVRAKLAEVYGGLSKDMQGHKLSIPYTVLGILHDTIPDNWQSEQDNWISVDDGLPPEKVEVLVINQYGRIRSASWMEYTGQNKEWFEISFTHWQPLPKKPLNKGK